MLSNFKPIFDQTKVVTARKNSTAGIATIFIFSNIFSINNGTVAS
jgi:hypothetical protein